MERDLLKLRCFPLGWFVFEISRIMKNLSFSVTQVANCGRELQTPVSHQALQAVSAHIILN